MLDIKRIKEDPEKAKAGLRAKEVDCDQEVDRILELDKQRRDIIHDMEQKKAEQNKVSKTIPQLKKAGEELAQVLESVELSPLDVPYVTNVTAQQVTDISQTKELLAEQVSSSVRWQQSMENLIADGVDTFIEIGPGRTLAGFMRKISRDVTVYNVGTWADVEKVAESLK